MQRDHESRDLEESRDGDDRRVNEDAVRTALSRGHPLRHQRPRVVRQETHEEFITRPRAPSALGRQRTAE